LKEKGVKVHYVPVDISQHLLEQAVKKLSGVAASVKPLHIDFDSAGLYSTLSEMAEFPKIVALLGATHGNHSNEIRILSNIKEIMGSQDHFITTVTVYNPLIAHAVDRFAKNKHLRRLFLSALITFLGTPYEKLDLAATFSQETKTIYLIARIKEDVETYFDDRDVHLPAGTRIIVGRIRRYSPAFLMSLLEEAGMIPYTMAYDKKGDYIFTVDALPRKYL